MPIVYVQGRDGFHIPGFYLWIQDPWGGDGSLITHAHPPEGMLTINDTVFLHAVSVCFPEHDSDLGSGAHTSSPCDEQCHLQMNLYVAIASTEHTDYDLQLVQQSSKCSDRQVLQYIKFGYPFLLLILVNYITKKLKTTI